MMMKKIGTVFLLMLFGSALCEGMSEGEKFIGVEVNIAEVQGDASGIVKDDVSKGASFGLRLGSQNDQWRNMFVWDSFDSEYRSVMKFFLSLDYLFPTAGMVGEYNFQPYLGLNVGYMNYESIDVKADGLLYGGQAGILFEMTEYVNFDIGYRYSLSTEETLDHASEVLFGIQYEY
ncbi:MAG: hypothetical protein DSZ09_03980 [Sulfurovum sp.]|nr:MAG: hypothetical protein DSZ09_03980 [Sulfurovum sp.]RUM74803.1 MAG: hypothetical protein DSZ12_04850 [Sulfurovum sp.]